MRHICSVSAIRNVYSTVETTGKLTAGEASFFAPQVVGGTREIFFKPHEQIKYTTLGHSVSLGIEVSLDDEEKKYEVSEVKSEHLRAICSLKDKQEDGEEVILVTHNEDLDKHHASITRLTGASSHSGLLRKPKISVIKPNVDALLTDSAIPTMVRAFKPAEYSVFTMFDDLKVMQLKEDKYNPYAHTIQLYTIGRRYTTDTYVAHLGLDTLNIHVPNILLMRANLKKLRKITDKNALTKIKDTITNRLLHTQLDTFNIDIVDILLKKKPLVLIKLVCSLATNIATTCQIYEQSEAYERGCITADIAMAAVDAVFVVTALSCISGYADTDSRIGIISPYTYYVFGVLTTYLRAQTKYNIFNLAVHTAIHNTRLQSFIIDITEYKSEAIEVVKALSLMRQLMR